MVIGLIGVAPVGVRHPRIDQHHRVVGDRAGRAGDIIDAVMAVDLQQRMHMRVGMFVHRLVGLKQRDPPE